MKKLSPLKQIRQYCLSCCGGSTKEVSCCPSTDCELWELRFGMSRTAAIRRKGRGSESLFDKEALTEGLMPRTDEKYPESKETA